jgi:hypothetical protein
MKRLKPFHHFLAAFVAFFIGIKIGDSMLPPPPMDLFTAIIFSAAVGLAYMVIMDRSNR